MLIAVMFISLSAGYHDSDDEVTTGKRLPIFFPILLSFSISLICSSFAMFQKYVFEVKKIPVADYTFGYYLIRQSIAFVLSIFYFTSEPINWKLYILGSVGSVIDVFGGVFANYAIATRSPVGPIFALTDCQILLVTIVASIRMAVLPHWMQIFGLASGVFGACILT